MEKIETEQEYESALKRIEELMNEENELEILCEKVSDYEDKHFPQLEPPEHIRQMEDKYKSLLFEHGLKTLRDCYNYIIDQYNKGV